MSAVDILLSLEGHRLEVGKDLNGQIMVHYYHCEVKNGIFLTGVTGRADTFNEACEDYLSQIRGKTLVFNAYSDSRKEVTVL